MDANEKSTVQADIDALKEIVDRTANQDSISESDVEALKAGKEKLMNSAQSVFAKMYQQNQQAGGPAPDMNAGQTSGNSGNNDDVVDGDYREV